MFVQDISNTTSTPVSIGSMTIQSIFNAHDNVTNVALSTKNSSVVMLDQQCTRVLVYADQVYVLYLLCNMVWTKINLYSLKNSKREELALIGSEFWMLGIAFFAVCTSIICAFISLECVLADSP